MFLISPDAYRHGPRNRTGRQTSPKQTYSNYKNALKKFRRLVKTNFSSGSDWYITLTYNSQFLPTDGMAAVDELRKFKNRLSAMCSRKEIELRLIGVTEQGNVNGRLHHHVFINADVPKVLILRAWRNKQADKSPREAMGNIFFDTVPADVDNLETISAYSLKAPLGKHRWVRTRNLLQPELEVNDKMINYGEYVQLGYGGFDRAGMYMMLCEMYPGYNPVSYKGSIVDIMNRSPYLSASLEAKLPWENVGTDVREWCHRFGFSLKQKYVNWEKKIISLNGVDRWINKKSCRLPCLPQFLTFGWRDYMARYLAQYVRDGMSGSEVARVFDERVLSDDRFGKLFLSYVGGRM